MTSWPCVIHTRCHSYLMCNKQMGLSDPELRSPGPIRLSTRSIPSSPLSAKASSTPRTASDEGINMAARCSGGSETAADLSALRTVMVDNVDCRLNGMVGGSRTLAAGSSEQQLGGGDNGC